MTSARPVITIDIGSEPSSSETRISTLLGHPSETTTMLFKEHSGLTVSVNSRTTTSSEGVPYATLHASIFTPLHGLAGHPHFAVYATTEDGDLVTSLLVGPSHASPLEDDQARRVLADAVQAAQITQRILDTITVSI